MDKLGPCCLSGPYLHSTRAYQSFAGFSSQHAYVGGKLHVPIFQTGRWSKRRITWFCCSSPKSHRRSAGEWNWNHVSQAPQPLSHPPFTRHDKCSAIKLALQKSQLSWWCLPFHPKLFCFSRYQPLVTVWSLIPESLICYGIHCKAPIHSEIHDYIPHIHWS